MADPPPNRPRERRPLWAEEVPIDAADERYVTRRQLTKFLVLTSFGMFVGNVWIMVRRWFRREPDHRPRTIARVDDVPIGGSMQFSYPREIDHCLLIRLGRRRFVAYSQKCTHLSCAVFYSQEAQRLECPCHEGYFAVEDGQVLQGPPPRPLPRIVLRVRGDQVQALGVELQPKT